jgi:hypothetical protein
VIGPVPATTARTRPAHSGERVRVFLQNNGLSIAAVCLFVVVWIVGQALTGLHVYNADQETHGETTVGLGSYLTSSHFGEATFENWESEFLQMGAYVLLTVWLFQRGSAESKPLDGENGVDDDPGRHRDDPGAPWPVPVDAELAVGVSRRRRHSRAHDLPAAAGIAGVQAGARAESRHRYVSPVGPSSIRGQALHDGAAHLRRHHCRRCAAGARLQRR